MEEGEQGKEKREEREKDKVTVSIKRKPSTGILLLIHVVYFVNGQLQHNDNPNWMLLLYMHTPSYVM